MTPGWNLRSLARTPTLLRLRRSVSGAAKPAREDGPAGICIRSAPSCRSPRFSAMRSAGFRLSCCCERRSRAFRMPGPDGRGSRCPRRRRGNLTIANSAANVIVVERAAAEGAHISLRVPVGMLIIVLLWLWATAMH
jgi:hypothetical protein